MKWFKLGLNKEQLKAEYYKLTKKYHPDLSSGNPEIMKEINAEYDDYFTLNRKSEIDFNWDDILERYSNYSRKTILLYFFKDKIGKNEWYAKSYQNTYLFSYYKNITIKYISDDSDTWNDFHGGFAFVTYRENYSAFNEYICKRENAIIEAPTKQDIWFAILYGTFDIVQNDTSILDPNNNIQNAGIYCSFYINNCKLSHMLIKEQEFWINRDSNNIYVKVNGIVVCAKQKTAVLLNNAKTLEEFNDWKDIGFYQFQECSYEEFCRTHDVDYKPIYFPSNKYVQIYTAKYDFNNNIKFNNEEFKELYWIDDPTILYFIKIGVIKLYKSVSNFRMRWGTFDSKLLIKNIHLISIDDAELIQDFLDDINSQFEDYTKSLIKKGKIKII